MFKKIYNWIVLQYQNYRNKKKLEKKIKELRKRDPFIYNH